MLYKLQLTLVEEIVGEMQSADLKLDGEKFYHKHSTLAEWW